MKTPLQRPLADYLEYLDGIGFGDLYLDRGKAESEPSRKGKSPSEYRTSKHSGSPHLGSSQSQSRAELSTKEPTIETGPIDSPAPVPGPTANRSTGPLTLATLATEAEECTACGLCQRRQRVVFGSGHPEADLMLIGEGPGAEEDRQGLPFVGPAGELLTKILGAIGLQRDQVYIANMVKCRPPNNRDPLPDEVAACRRFLENQIDLVKPKVIVALGRVAAQDLLQTTESLGRLRGRWHDVRGIQTRATYHPAALLRYQKWKRPTWEDMQVVRDALLSD